MDQVSFLLKVISFILSFIDSAISLHLSLNCQSLLEHTSQQANMISLKNKYIYIYIALIHKPSFDPTFPSTCSPRLFFTHN